MEILGGGLLTVTLCLGGLLALSGLISLGIVLLKLGVVGSYWLKGEGSTDEAGVYGLDQSREA
ncbi:MAG: hypothetical protein JSV81_05525 [Anaerolineales bacterium]|nr:MAG: hypothetical protein JSV81_05525 [Anaerolineales bacterium]